MAVRGIRGATTVSEDNSEEVISATLELLKELLQSNEIDDFEEIASAIFTTTADVTSTFPAEAARRMGMSHVPLLCAREISVEGSMSYCIRILLHLNTEKKQGEMKHVYLREAKKLRPDVSSAQ